jgi:uncharacterized membrane protein YeaQ/YmgE (transglycosylase-associated protein family)
MTQPLLLATFPHLMFLALALIGAGVGWASGLLVHTQRWIATFILIGVAGAWIGSQLADMLGVAAHISPANLVAALVGALTTVESWRWLHPD